jgi:hypothetical protein
MQAQRLPMHITPFCWNEDTLHCVLAQVSKGQRVNTKHAGSEQGFIPNADIQFK